VLGHSGGRGVVSETHGFIIGMKVYVELVRFKSPYSQQRGSKTGKMVTKAFLRSFAHITHHLMDCSCNAVREFVLFLLPFM
jgi:hypothetical protein